MEELEREAMQSINTLSDEELANITGGAGSGVVKTATSECYLGTIAFICCLGRD
ncbi:type A2 lanthipeptide [Solibacillus sp. FSL K6-1126]|uniref:type A2 lanthipeptide n=1 Tax=Solibacillus sp. FSL K6-1126 TaxID=2921463 RepID=UPI0030F4D521